MIRLLFGLCTALLLSPATAGAQYFSAKFATGGQQGLYTDENVSVTASPPDGACGVAFGDVPGADPEDVANTEPGNFYLSTSSSGSTFDQLYTNFPTISWLTVFFGGFGAGCGFTRVQENANANPWSFPGGTTALLIEADDFVFVDSNGVFLDEDDPSVPFQDPTSNIDRDFGTEIDVIDFLLSNAIHAIVVNGPLDRTAPATEAIARRLSERAASYKGGGAELARRPLELAATVASHCAEAVRALPDLPNDITAQERQVHHTLARESCSAAANFVRQVRLASSLASE